MDEKTEKSLTDCFFFLQGSCTKGASCEYRHSSNALLTQNFCRYWPLGQCRNVNCIFRHPTNTVQKKVPCYYFQHGSCSKGVACPFSHVLSSPVPPTNPDSIVVPDDLLLAKKKEEIRLLEEKVKKQAELEGEKKTEVVSSLAVPQTTIENARSSKSVESQRKTASSLQPAKQMSAEPTNVANQQRLKRNSANTAHIAPVSADSVGANERVDFGVKPLSDLLSSAPKGSANNGTNTGVGKPSASTKSTSSASTTSSSSTNAKPKPPAGSAKRPTESDNNLKSTKRAKRDNEEEDVNIDDI